MWQPEIPVWQALRRAEKALEAGDWDESASLIAQAQLTFGRGDASDKELRLADQLMARLRDAKEASEARARGLDALISGEYLIALCTG